MQEAKAELRETEAVLFEAMEKMKAIEDNLAKLQKVYNASVKKKKDLENKCKLCEARMIRADKVNEIDFITMIFEQ